MNSNEDRRLAELASATLGIVEGDQAPSRTTAHLDGGRTVVTRVVLGSDDPHAALDAFLATIAHARTTTDPRVVVVEAQLSFSYAFRTDRIRTRNDLLAGLTEDERQAQIDRWVAEAAQDDLDPPLSEAGKRAFRRHHGVIL